MDESEETVETAYGRLDKAALIEAQRTFDTRRLLTMIDELNELISLAMGEDGLRDMLLRLHAMTHVVINGAELSVDTDGQTLPELADEITTDLYGAISSLQRWAKWLEPLESLQPKDY